MQWIKLWSVCQRYNLKAIHNCEVLDIDNNLSCDRYVKDTIWKQFTTLLLIWYIGNELWSVCQRYNLKAIHNSDEQKKIQDQVVIGMSKIQSESNSQHKVEAYELGLGCDRYVKDTIWKQFTTCK